MRFSIALAVGLVMATAAYAGPAPGTAGAKAGGAGVAAGAGVAGSGKVSIKSRSVTDTKPLHATATSHGVAVGRGVPKTKARAAAGATVNAHLNDEGVAVVGANAKAGAKAKAGKASAAINGPLVHAQAAGGAHPTASTKVVGKNGKVITQASARAGGGATASGGKTTITHFGPHKQDTLAVTYTPKAYSAAVSTPKTATAYSGYAAQGVSFKGPTLLAAIQLAAYAYATAGNNYAYGSANAYATAGSRSIGSLAYADIGVYAQAFVAGNTVILKAGKTGAGQKQQYCIQTASYPNRTPEVILTCRALPWDQAHTLPTTRPAHRLSH